MDSYTLLSSLAVFYSCPNFSSELKLLHQQFGDTSLPLSDLVKVLPVGAFREFYSQLPKRWWHEAEREVGIWKKNGLSLTHPLSSDYPRSWLEKLSSPPCFVIYKGQPVWNVSDAHCLSVVGSRRPLAESLQWMEQHLTRLLQSRTDLVVVSGGARGVDQKAHALSLRNGRSTLCVLPSGLEQIYPQDLRSWEESFVAGGGALISCYHPRARVHKSHFHQRNRLIAAFSELVFIVEAQRKSGSWLTAMAALKQGSQLITLPMAAWQTQGAGNLDLIFDGAEFVRDHQDLSLLVDRYLKPVANERQLQLKRQS